MIQLLHRRGFLYDQLPVVLWGVVIFVSSSIPNLALPKISSVSVDKAVHLIVYVVLTALVHRAIAHQDKVQFLARNSIAWSFIIAVGFGATDEIHQSFVPNRDASFVDLMADAIGALLFVTNKFVWSRMGQGPGQPD